MCKYFILIIVMILDYFAKASKRGEVTPLRMEVCGKDSDSFVSICLNLNT